MSLYYFLPFIDLPGNNVVSYSTFGGNIKVIVQESATINVAEVANADFLTLPPPIVSAWCYALFWNASISLSTEAKNNSKKTFSSLPIRYDFGHLTTFDSVGVTWDEVLKFEDQKVPLQRTHIVEGQPNTGGIPTEFETPLQISAALSWANNTNSDNLSSLCVGRSNTLGVYLRSTPAEAIVNINYYALLQFDATNIIINSNLVGIFP